ncbi:hypothetical protein [Clostridium thailandense]|uniref:hypothetical protein n=1 Tax=Clostridium thailandense TaxID=2794346 RepID=UPI001FECF8B5|nr:hypothetical protein [Clostridium thailandense]
MQNNTNLAPHEMLELHELISGEIVSLKRTQANISMVNDNELKNYMQQCLNSKKTAIEQIQNFISTQYNSYNNQNQNAQNQGNQNQNTQNQSNQSQDNQNQVNKNNQNPQEGGGNSSQNSSS